jgi:hypothetical protein
LGGLNLIGWRRIRMIQSDNRRLKEMDNIGRDDRGRGDRGRDNKGRNNRRMVDEGIIQAAIKEMLFFRRRRGRND